MFKNYIDFLKSNGLDNRWLLSECYYYQYIWMFKYINSVIPEDAEVLDWGAGTGFMTYFLSQRNLLSACTPEEDDYTIYCDLLKSTCNNVGADFKFLTDKVRLPYDDESFDAALSIGVLEHVAEFGGSETASIIELQRILKHNGLLIVTHLPRHYSYIEFVNRLLNRPHHKFTYKKKQILSIVAQRNLRLVKIQKYGLLPKYILVNLHLRYPAFFTKKVVKLLVLLDQYLSRIPVLNLVAQNYHITLQKVG